MTTSRSLRTQLQTEFGCDLSERKDWIKKQLKAAAQSAPLPPAPAAATTAPSASAASDELSDLASHIEQLSIAGLSPLHYFFMALNVSLTFALRATDKKKKTSKGEQVKAAPIPSSSSSSSSSSAAASTARSSTLKPSSAASATATLHSTKLGFLLRELRAMQQTDATAKAVVFSQWTGMLDCVAQALQTEGYVCGASAGAASDDSANVQYRRLDGQMNTAQQQASLHSFANDPNTKVFLISLKAGGVGMLLLLRVASLSRFKYCVIAGLNLTSANYLFLLDLWWNPAIEAQCFDRVYRVGQRKPVFVHRIVIQDTVEENIAALQARKASLASEALGDADRAEAATALSGNNNHFLPLPLFCFSHTYTRRVSCRAQAANRSSLWTISKCCSANFCLIKSYVTSCTARLSGSRLR